MSWATTHPDARRRFMKRYRQTPVYKAGNRRRSKAWRDWCVREGICTRCRRRPATHGRKCKPCRTAWLLPARLFHLKYRGMPKKEVQKAQMAWLVFDQICQACGRKRCCGSDWAFDHCHKTKKFRGIVGRKCNTVLGMVEDDIEVLKSLVKYLRIAGRR